MEIYIDLGFLGILARVTLILASVLGVLGILRLGLGRVAVLVGQLVPDRLKETIVLVAVTVRIGAWRAKKCISIAEGTRRSVWLTCPW